VRVASLASFVEQYFRALWETTATRLFTGHIEATPHWAGESVVGVKRIQPAAEIIHELSGEAEELLRRCCL